MPKRVKSQKVKILQLQGFCTQRTICYCVPVRFKFMSISSYCLTAVLILLSSSILQDQFSSPCLCLRHGHQVNCHFPWNLTPVLVFGLLSLWLSSSLLLSASDQPLEQSVCHMTQLSWLQEPSGYQKKTSDWLLQRLNVYIPQVHSSLLHSVNLILFTVLLVHLILRILSHHSHHLYSHHPSLPLPWLKTHLFHKSFPFLHSHSYSFRTDFTDHNLYWIKGALFVCFSFWLRVLD